MARMRVHELAKELNMNNKDLLDRILRLGIQVKNHMSTLTDSAVQKIRQQFSETRSEKVEEKRIGRAVIRRRRKTEEEGAAAELQPEEAARSFEPSHAEIAEREQALDKQAEAREEAVSAEEAPAAEASEESKEVVSPPPEVESPAPLEAIEKEEAVIAQVASREPSLPQEEIRAEAVPAPPVQEEAPQKQADTIAPPPREAKETPISVAAEAVSVQPEAQERIAEEKVPAAKKPEPPAEPAVEVALTKPIHVVPAPVEKVAAPVEAAPQEKVEEAQAAEEDEDKAKPKKAKKRRRKKARKDEPARIIKLPEIISEEAEPEEEVEIPAIAPRLLKAEEVESKEAARKRRLKPEEAEREAADRKRRPQRRKEVFEREDLYSKKELAAQADRERLRDKDRGILREVAKVEPAVIKPGKRRIKIDEAITVGSLARQMGVKAGEVIKKLLLLGLTANINQALDLDAATLVASEFDFEVEKVGFEEENILQMQEDSPEDMAARPPVVTVMGHVDHGKTSLLDAIRHTNVIGGEAGGITQHIGAYFVKLDKGDVVFLDTPGHEAFTSMRARGAKVTDIVVLVVAADDGVMQQTIEAINHARAAQVPIIVAINKIDKPNANLDRVKRELSDHGLLPEEWGGSVTMVEISAKKRLGIEDLLEMILLQSELMELKSNPAKAARGHVIEAKLDKGRGPVATILVQEGTLRAGDVYVCGVHAGRVRNMFNDRGQRIEVAGPSTPVEVLGFSGVPNAGDDFIVIQDEKQAKMVAEHRLIKQRERELTRTSKVTLESLFEQIQEGEIKELNVILKTDVQGSLEAISDSLLKLSTPEVKINLIHNATGAITETDIMLASASNAIVIGFNMRGDTKVQELADQENVDVRYYDVIYQLLNDIKDAMVGMLEPVYQEHVLGRAEVRQTFHVPKYGTIAGCYVTDGKIERSAKVRLLRDSVIIYDGKISSLKRFKDDVKEVKTGFECGLGIENYNDVKVGDILEVYELQAMKPSL